MPVCIAPAGPDLPSNWLQMFDYSSGHHFYHHVGRGVATWDFPSDSEGWAGGASEEWAVWVWSGRGADAVARELLVRVCVGFYGVFGEVCEWGGEWGDTAWWHSEVQGSSLCSGGE